MPATSPATKAESWADAIILRPVGEPDSGNLGVPSFALLETRGPDPSCLILSVIILTSLLSLSVVLGHFVSVTPQPPADSITFLDLPAEPQAPITLPRDVSATPALPPKRAVSDRDVPVLPEPAKAQPPPVKAPPPAPDLVAVRVNPPQLAENARPDPVQPARALASTAPPSTPAVTEAPKPSPAPAPQAPVSSVVARDVKVPEHAVPTDAAAGDGSRAAPKTLGGVALSQLIDEQDGLAAGLAALPSTERLNLPRVSIRVNAEWVEALPKTQERLYFSITRPEADREVLAYLPDSHSFELERPQHPLWKIHEGDRVPALAALRAEAGQWLGVSPNLVGLYTWHPPVLEDALRMFVLERMEELRVHLGPQDWVTVRLTASANGTVMNLEPLYEEDSR